MSDKIVDWAIKIQALAKAGLSYSENPFDIERYKELQEIAAEMLSVKTGNSLEKVMTEFCRETGYVTPKVDTRAAIFKDDKILMVHEKNDTWALPGGWCDVDQSVASNIRKESEEEAGAVVEPDFLIAVHDWRLHNRRNLPFGVVKFFVHCNFISANFKENSETSETAFFAENQLPEKIADEKDTAEQIKMCFEAHRNAESWKTQFD